MTTGTRTQVAEIAIDWSPRILRVSLISLRSSSVWSSPGAKLPGVRERVEGDLVGVGVGRGDLALVQQRVRLVEQLVDGPLAGARDGLVGADHEPLDAGRVVQRLERDDHLHRRAVGVGDDPAVAVERLAD